MGLKTVLPISFTDTSLPILRDDQLLSAGSLLLVDVGHSLGGFAGVPVHQQRMTNLARATAKALTGAATEAATDPMWHITGMTGTKGKIERTAKGGVHAIFSQTQNSGASDPTHCALVAPSAADLGPATHPLRAYMLANADHSFYFSKWDRYTRQRLVDSTHNAGLVDGIYTTGAGSTNGNFWAHMRSTAVGSSFVLSDEEYPGSATVNHLGTPQRNGYRHSGLPTPASGPRIHNIATTSYTGSAAFLDNTNMNVTPWVIGNYSGPNFVTAVLGAAGSAVFYRAYIEDLTVSGRTYAQVDAIDKALFDKAFAVGGYLYGDNTPTDPSTIP